MFIRLTITLNLLRKTDSEFRGDKQGLLHVIFISIVPEAEVRCLEQLIAGADHYSGLYKQSESNWKKYYQYQAHGGKVWKGYLNFLTLSHELPTYPLSNCLGLGYTL